MRRRMAFSLGCAGATDNFFEVETGMVKAQTSEDYTLGRSPGARCEGTGIPDLLDSEAPIYLKLPTVSNQDSRFKQF
jgi:hypothetical protein